MMAHLSRSPILDPPEKETPQRKSGVVCLRKREIRRLEREVFFSASKERRKNNTHFSFDYSEEP